MKDNVATALTAQFNAYATPSKLQERIVRKIQDEVMAVVQDGEIALGDKYDAVTTALANVIDTLSPESAAASDEEVSPGVTLRQYIQTELADADNYVDDGAVADLIADLNGKINTALTADEVLAALNNVDVTIHNSAVTMNDTSAIENNYGKVIVSGTSAINVPGGTGLEPATFNTITAKEDVVFADASTLTVGKAELEENENGSKLNITSATGDILFEGAGSATVNAGSALSLSAANGGITYAKDGNFIIGSAAEDARTATLTITSAGGIDTNYRTDYRDFWYDGGTDHHAQINTDDTPGKAHAGLYIDDANPAVAALGATYGENTFVFEDAQLTANNAEITGNLAFHADEHIATDNINNSFVSGNVTVANESGGAFMLNAATSTIGGAVNAYTGRYVFNDAVDPADDTLAYMGGATTLDLGQVGKTVTTTGWAMPDGSQYSLTNVIINISTGRADDPEEEGDQSVDGSITMTGGLNNLTVGNAVDATVVNGNVAMTGKEANLIVSANATVTGNVTVSDATPATLTLNGTIGGDATFTGNVKLAASTASSGTVTGALALADDKTFDMQNGSYSTAYAGRYDHLTVGKITAGTVTNTGVLTLAGETNENVIGGTGSIVIDSENLTTTGALNQAVRVNAAKQLTAIADLIGADVTNNGTVVLKEGTLRHNITFGENADLSIVDGDANAETGVTSNVNLAKATIQNNALLIINADKVRGVFVNNLGGTVNLTGGTLTKALGGKVTLSGATTFGTGADFTGATIKMTEAGSLNIGTNKVTANSVDGGTIFMTLTENAVEDTLVNIAEVVNHDVALSVDNNQVSRFDVQHYYLTATDTGYNLTLTGAGRYAIDTQLFTLEDALTMEAFDPATWHGGDLYMLKLATVAEVAAEKQTESGIVVSQNEQIALQSLSDESRAALTAGQQAQFDQINTRLANAVDAGNREEIRQILREVGAEKAPAVAQTEIANVGAVMNVVGTRLGGGAPAPAAAASGDHGRSGGDEIIAGKASVWGQYMLNTAKLTGITADYDANTLGVQALTGYSFGNWTPEGGLRYTNVRQKAYTNSLGVRFANKTNDTLTGIVGLRYAKTFKAGSGLLITPEGKLALTYDLSRSNQGRSVTLANGTGYVAEGKNLDRTGLELGAGVSFKVNDSLDIGLSYEGKFRKDYSDHTGLFNVKYNF